MTKKTLTKNNFENLSHDQQAELLDLLKEKADRKKYSKMDYVFQDEGPLNRHMYPKHLEFFKAGNSHKERAFIAANRSGKTFSAAYETTLHLTGRYPDWWEGRRFRHPVEGWAAGMTNETTRDIIQKELLGIRGDYGAGMIPKDCIERTTTRPGIPDAVQDVYIKHKSGGLSVLTLKSYVQGIEAYMGTAKHFVWFDEEPMRNIYSEALTRTMTTDGIVYLTFTPLQGLTETILSFLPGGKFPEDQVPV